jgi:hypothetical protein
VVGDQTQKKKNPCSDQKNPYDLVLQLFFDGIFYHGFSSLRFLEINLKFLEIVSLTFFIKGSLSFEEQWWVSIG